MKKLLLVFLSFTCLNVVMAQKVDWSAHTDLANISTDKAVKRASFPKEFKLFDLNRSSFSQELFSIVGKNVVKHSKIISLPNADGGIEQFEIVEASNFEPALQERFPEIRAFSGRGITDKSATLKLSVSPQGVQTIVFRTEKENECIEAYSKDHNVYAIFKSHRNIGKLPWTCSTQDQNMASEITDHLRPTGMAARSGGDLKVMRLAQSVTAEYSNYFGATSASQVALVLSGINATLTRCNGVYEKDLALHLNLVAASTNVIYYNPSTDPYDNASTGAGGTWNSQLQSTLTSVIGEANYDIGHLFGASGGGGNAGCIGCICTNGSKGSGFTSPADGIPQGDNFDIDYVVHEVGHQLGANHTFSYSNEGAGQGKEVGSGITIMGYAGITSYDVAAHSIDIYHETSIAQIQANLATKTCPVTYTIVNAAPVVATLSNYTIPISTPFALTGSATDANASDVLTYCWEQNDNGGSQTAAKSKASATKTAGPNWISFRPTTSPTRYFPQLSTILAGGLTTGPLTGGDAGVTTEALSSVSRTLNFRLTVRDNAPYSSTAPISVGQTNFKDMVVTVSNTSGPFAVSVPNTAVSWVGGSTQTITWAVASTTASPVSCANVKISLSTDGGQTFPTILAASTANDGSEALVIPNTATTTARIKIEAIGNIFFDISNTNFTITAGSACGAATGLASAAVTTNSATVSWAAVSGATSYAVAYKLNTSATWTSFSTAQTATTANLTGLTSGSLYDWRVIATCSSGAGAAVAAQFTTQTICVAPSGLSSTPGTTTATVNWTAVGGAVSYAVDYKLNTSATWTSFSTVQTGTSSSLTGLIASSLYDWRVSATCPSGTTSATTAQFTTTAPPICNTPSGLSSIPGSTTATVSWTAVSGAVSYAVDYKLNTSATWTSFSTAQTGISATLTGLTASSLYDWRVTTNCSFGSSTASAAQLTTTVPPVCNAPTGLSSTPGSTTATISWTAVSGAVSYAVDYKLNTSATWTSFSTAQTGISASLTALTASSLYDWRVTTNCSFGSSTASAAQFTTTAPVCNAPTGLSSTPGSTIATVSWTAVSGALSYAVGYKLNTSATWMSFSTAQTGTSANLTGLTASSLYDWRVSTNCSSGTSTATAAQFTTTAASTCATAFEPNATQAAAAAIISGVTNSAAISTSTDIDYYSITTTGANNIVYNLVGPSGVDYDLFVYNSAGTQIGLSESSTATETVTLNSQAAGTYYIKVIGYNGATSATCYTIKATATAAGTSCQSSYDASTNGTSSGASVIPLNTNITGLISPSADLDYYKFTITTGGTITLTLTTLPGDYDLKLFSSNGTTQVGISQNGSTNSETINYTAAAGTYYAQVYGYNGANSATTCYTLKVATGTATRNELLTTAVTKKQLVDVFPNPVKDIVNVNITGYEGNSAITVYDQFGRLVMRKPSNGINTKIDMSSMPAGIYMVKIVNGNKEIATKKVVKN